MKTVSCYCPLPVLTALAVIASVALTGCAPLTGEKAVWKKLPWIGEKEEEPYPNPQKMAVTWAPDVIVRTGATPTRGFGGRVFFYDEKTRPVPVDGELAIQAFIPGPDGKPQVLKRYGFTAEQFTRHYSQSDLGGSYSIWIPWDAVGGDETKVTLIPSFRTKEGKTVSGTASVVHLPGKNDRMNDPPFNPANADMYAGGASSRSGAWTNSNASPELFRRSGLTTTTIPAGRSRQSNPSFGNIQTSIAGNRSRPVNQSRAAAERGASPPTVDHGVLPASATEPIRAATE